MLIMQGALDDNMLPAVQEKFAATYKAAGGVCELTVFEGSDAIHGEIGNDTISGGAGRDAHCAHVRRERHSITRSSRWIISARPLTPRIAITSGEDRPLIFSASSAS